MINLNNVILIGMPGAGKSTLGVLLAKALGYSFIDTDLILQHREGQLLQEIIELKGLEVFKAIENKMLTELDLEKHVIATGGSVVYCEEGMRHLKSQGLLIYIELSYETVEKRLHNIKTRGIAMDKTQSLHDIYIERCSLYKAYADMVVNCDGTDIETSVSKLLNILEENK
ncbi:shikimate kinase [Vallitalea okinawensis]|uniref:shikimate kinase n=1 Tax=Vallitalea okinawensis TaxID=2078660 RepID=UPI002E8DFB4A|nr:shikimate kinase [Vallitalea okinawensis]